MKDLLNEITEEIKKSTNKIKGGIADESKPSEFCPKQLAAGIKVEMEHTDDESKAKEIAMDHLKEIPDYYTRLKDMENEAGIKKGGAGSGQKGHKTVLDATKHLGVTRMGKPIPRNFNDSHEHEYSLEDHKDAMNSHQDHADSLNERVSEFQEKYPDKNIPKNVTEIISHHLDQSRKHQAVGNRLQEIRNRNEKQVSDTLSQRSKKVKKAGVMADYSGTVLDTNDLANEINSIKDSVWLQKITDSMKDYNYGDQPREINLDSGNVLFLTKVDDGLYSGFVKKLNPENELPETSNAIKIERMPIPTMITYLRMKEAIDLIEEDTPVEVSQEDAGNLLEKLETHLEPEIEDELMINPKDNKIRVLELIKEILEDVN